MLCESAKVFEKGVDPQGGEEKRSGQAQRIDREEQDTGILQPFADLAVGLPHSSVYEYYRINHP